MRWPGLLCLWLEMSHEGIKLLDINPETLTDEERQALFVELDAGQYANKFPDDEMAQLRWAIFEEKRRTVRALVQRVIVTRVEGPEKRKFVVVLSLDIPAQSSLAYSYQAPDYKAPGL